MHNVRVTAACKIPSHTQSTIFYWLDEVNRSIQCVQSLFLYVCQVVFSRKGGTDILTLTLLCPTKSRKNYLQNTQHVVLRNRPTLSIGTERLACLNNPHGMQLGPSPSTRQVPSSSPGPGGRAASFLHPPFLPPLWGSFFCTFPTKPTKVLGLRHMGMCCSNKLFFEKKSLYMGHIFYKTIPNRGSNLMNTWKLWKMSLYFEKNP